MTALRGPGLPGPRTLNCGANPKSISSCLAEGKVQTCQGDGEWVTDGYYPVK